MKETLMKKSILHVDETYAQVLNRSDGKPAQSKAYNWVFRSVLPKDRQLFCSIVHYPEVGKF
ncbi:transposase [Ureibacillus sp. FSL K6-3587]|uniref:IS66 family transposase n=1 Tax=Ureibacillus sp. FSL K6-3587 TaxID=2954681 RepID=UPI003157F56A